MAEAGGASGRIALAPRGQWTIRAIMVAIGVAAPLCALARIEPYLGMIATAYLALFGALAFRGRPAGGVAIPLATAIGTSAALIAGWGVIRGVAQPLVIRLVAPEEWTVNSLSRIGWLPTTFDSWTRLARWEAWSLLRWWLLFGAIAWIGGRREDRPRQARVLLGFAWGLAALEVGFLFATWFAFGSTMVVPEPSTTFATGWSPSVWFRTRSLQFWTLRAVFPTLLIGLVFSRVVMRAPWWKGTLGAIGLVPVAVVVSIAWSLLYLLMREWNLIP